MNERMTPEHMTSYRIDGYRAAARGELVIRSWADQSGEVIKEVVASPDVDVDFFDEVDGLDQILGPIARQN